MPDDLDLDAIRARAEAAESFSWISWPAGSGYRQIGLCFTGHDGPDVTFTITTEMAAQLDAALYGHDRVALLDRLTEVEANHVRLGQDYVSVMAQRDALFVGALEHSRVRQERDEARAALARQLEQQSVDAGHFAAENARLRKDLDLNKAGWAAEIERLYAVEAEREAMRPVVGAAKAWLAAMRAINLDEAARNILGEDFVVGIDSLQDTPSNPPVGDEQAEVMPEWERALLDDVRAAETHVYRSTACHHGEHQYCSATARPDGAAKAPGRCKFCPANCVCDCHSPADKAEAPGAAQAITRDWMAHLGYTADEVAFAETPRDHSFCVMTEDGEGGSDCDEAGGEEARHPIHDEMDGAAALVMFVLDSPHLNRPVDCERMPPSSIHPEGGSGPEGVCRAEYIRPGGRQRGDRIVRCGLPAGVHEVHEEVDTEVRWTRAGVLDPRLVREPWTGEGCSRSANYSEGNVHDHPSPVDPNRAIAEKIWDEVAAEHGLAKPPARPVTG